MTLWKKDWDGFSLNNNKGLRVVDSTFFVFIVTSDRRFPCIFIPRIDENKGLHPTAWNNEFQFHAVTPNGVERRILIPRRYPQWRGTTNFNSTPLPATAWNNESAETLYNRHCRL